MRNLANQITGSVTQCVIMLKLDGKCHFKCVKYRMLKKEYSAHFHISCEVNIIVMFRV